MAIIGTLALSIPAQSTEILRAMCENQDVAGAALLVASTTWWAYTSWYFGRVMLHFKYPGHIDWAGDTGPYHTTITWAPRVVGTLSFVAVAIGLAPCARSLPFARSLLALTVATGTLFFVFVWKRRALVSKMLGGPADSRKKPVVPLPFATALVDLPRRTRAVLGAHLTLWLLLLTLFVAIPVPVGQHLGAATVLVLALGTWLAAGTAVMYAATWWHVPAVYVLVALVVAVSPLNDDHVLQMEPETLARQNIADDFNTWKDLQKRKDGGPPYLLVATEGGGIRAAYWTALVLSSLYDANPTFAQHLYALSSVSGGSLGAGVFLALLADQTPSESEKLEDRAKRVLAADFLAPLLGKMLYPDLVQRFLPFAWPALDRGKALEDSWSLAVTKEMSVSMFDILLDRIWREHPNLPRLFLNSTWVETGKRVIFSWPRANSPDCPDSVDGSSLGQIRLVEAVHASARFSYFSPAATLLESPGADPGWGGGHLVDGGYFENSGAATAEDIARAVGVPPGDLRGIIIRFEDAPKGSHTWLTEALSPPEALLAARDARGTLAVQSLCDYLTFDRVAEFRLDKPNGDVRLPLGWMLSEAARDEMTHQLNSSFNADSSRVVSEWARGNAAARSVHPSVCTPRAAAGLEATRGRP